MVLTINIVAIHTGPDIGINRPGRRPGKEQIMRWTLAVAAIIATLHGLPAPAAGETEPSDTERALRDEVAQLRRTVGVLAEEVERLRTEVVVPEEPELKSAYGLGPAASKVYGIGRGLSIGGYAEGYYRNFIGDADRTDLDRSDMLRMVMYLGYKFSDRILFNTEIEFEHATTSANFEGDSGDVSVEFATLDFLMHPSMNLRTGLLLVPMGFVNEIHEPPYFFGTQRPEAERRIIPTTWRENGAGIFGRLGESLEYRAYVVNGLKAEDFSSSGLRGGRQKGNRTLAEDIAFVGRVDFTPYPGLLVGGSYYTGDSGQDRQVAGRPLPDARTSIWEAHAQYQHGGLHLRGLYTQAHVSDAGTLSAVLGVAANQPVARKMIGGYAEIAYDVMPLLFPNSEMSLSPFFRFEYLDTQKDIPSGFSRDRGARKRLFVPGLSFKPHPNVVLKLDYRNIDDFEGEDADELNVGFGVAF
jgi:hypothetical protein